MAQDVKLRMTIDATRAKRDVDQVNKKLDQSDKKSEKFSKRARRVLGTATAVAAATAGVIDRASGGGFIGAAGDIGGSLVGAAGRAAGLTSPSLQQGIANNRALTSAIDETKALVSSGGSITDEEIKGLITGFRSLRQPGEQNAQRVEVIGQDIRAAKAIENAASFWKEVGQDIKNATRAGKVYGGR